MYYNKSLFVNCVCIQFKSKFKFLARFLILRCRYNHKLQMATDAIHVVSEMRYQVESYFACKTAMFMMIVQQ